ncbi:MAG: glycosyltransferase family 39 protein [Anaerolineae bacterium]
MTRLRHFRFSLSWILVVLVFLAFVLRVARLDQYPLWSDEFITLDRTNLALRDLLARLPIDQVPLYFVLVHAWSSVAGSTDFALRFPSVVWGCLGIPLIYQLGRQLFGPRVGIVAALLLAVNPFNIWYSQDARMYSQLTTLSIAALLLLRRAVVTGRRWAWVGYAAAATAALYTHLYAAIPLAAATVYGATWLYTTPSGTRRRRRTFLLTQAIVGVLLLPWLWRLVDMVEAIDESVNPDLTPSLVEFARLYVFGNTLPGGVTVWLGGAALALFAVGLVSLTRQWFSPAMRPAIVLAWASVVLPAAAMVVIQVSDVGFHPRYFSGVEGVYILTLAVGAVALTRRRQALGAATLAFVLAATVFSLTLFYTDPTYAKASYTDYLTHILANAGPKDALPIKGASQTKAERYAGDRLDRIVNLSGRVAQRPQAQVEGMVGEIAAEHRVVWLAIQYPEGPGYVKDWLDEHGYQVQRDQVDDIEVDDIEVYAYTFPQTMPAPKAPASMMGPAPVLLQWSAPASARAGDIVPVELLWQPTGSVVQDARVSLRLYNTRGDIVWQRDRVPGDGAHPSSEWRVGEVIADRYGIRLPRDLPPGRYTLRVILYNYANLGTRLQATLGTIAAS